VAGEVAHVGARGSGAIGGLGVRGTKLIRNSCSPAEPINTDERYGGWELVGQVPDGGWVDPGSSAHLGWPG
jgi:hypothetical protein